MLRYHLTHPASSGLRCHAGYSRASAIGRHLYFHRVPTPSSLSVPARMSVHQ